MHFVALAGFTVPENGVASCLADRAEDDGLGGAGLSGHSRIDPRCSLCSAAVHTMIEKSTRGVQIAASLPGLYRGSIQRRGEAVDVEAGK